MRDMLLEALEAGCIRQAEERERSEVLAALLLTIVDKRGIVLDEGQREAIDSTVRVYLLEKWFARAATADTAADIFEPFVDEGWGPLPRGSR